MIIGEDISAGLSLIANRYKAPSQEYRRRIVDATMQHIEHLEAELQAMHAAHPESGGCYAALPRLRAENAALREGAERALKIATKIHDATGNVPVLLQISIHGGIITPLHTALEEAKAAAEGGHFTGKADVPENIEPFHFETNDDPDPAPTNPCAEAELPGNDDLGTLPGAHHSQDLCQCGHMRDDHANYSDACWVHTCDCERFRLSHSHAELVQAHAALNSPSRCRYCGADDPVDSGLCDRSECQDRDEAERAAEIRATTDDSSPLKATSRAPTEAEQDGRCTEHGAGGARCIHSKLHDVPCLFADDGPPHGDVDPVTRVEEGWTKWFQEQHEAVHRATGVGGDVIGEALTRRFPDGCADHPFPVDDDTQIDLVHTAPSGERCVKRTVTTNKVPRSAVDVEDMIAAGYRGLAEGFAALGKNDSVEFLRGIALLEVSGRLTAERVEWAWSEVEGALNGLLMDLQAAIGDWSGEEQGGESVIRREVSLELRRGTERLVSEEITRMRAARDALLREVEAGSAKASLPGATGGCGDAEGPVDDERGSG